MKPAPPKPQGVIMDNVNAVKTGRIWKLLSETIFNILKGITPLKVSDTYTPLTKGREQVIPNSGCRLIRAIGPMADDNSHITTPRSSKQNE
ncbi:hypothetical protein D3C72_1713130 [compost metagenome]